MFPYRNISTKAERRCGRLHALDLLVRPGPQRKPLLFGGTPEEVQIRLVPDVNDKTFRHITILDILECLIEEGIPTCPITIVTRVLKVLRLTTIGTPNCWEEIDELSSVFASSSIVAQS